MYLDIKTILDQSSSFADFQTRLKEAGIKISFKESSTQKAVQGVIFTRGDYSVKGSKIDRSLGLGQILKLFKKKRAVELYEAQRHRGNLSFRTDQESRSESNIQSVAAALFEGNLGKSQEQDIKDPPKKRKGMRR